MRVLPTHTDSPMDAPAATDLSGRRYLVLGGRGFIGRHCVAALRRVGAEVLVGSRRPTKGLSRPVDLQGLPRPDAWRQILEPLQAQGLDAVVNAVGILRQDPWRDYHTIHHLAPAALASHCVANGLTLLHISALGLEPAACSRFILSKRAGDAAVRACGQPCLVLRPSLLDGPDGFGSRWLRVVSRLPLRAMPVSARGRIAALHVDDLGDAIARLLCLSPEQRQAFAPQGVVELGGQHRLTLSEYLHHLHPRAGRAWQVPVPHLLARAVAHLCDLLHLTPFSFGHLELLGRDNLPQGRQLQELLGRPERTLGQDSPPVTAVPDVAALPLPTQPEQGHSRP